MRSTATVAVKNSLRDKATTELIRLSMMVEYQANFNLEALESSGFELANKPKSKGQVGLVNDIRMKTNGVEGLVMVTCDRDPNARTYKARISTDQVNWTWFNAAPTRTVNVYNVPKGVKLYVQMQLQNAHGFSPWSASVMGEIPTDHMITSVHE